MSSALAVLRALADPTRLRVLALVRDIELAVGELADVLGQSQPRVSRHVRILADAELLQRHREGAWVFVRLGISAASERAMALLDALDGASEQRASDRERLAAVRAERAAAADAWFATHAGEWDRLRSLHVAEAEVETAIAAALAGQPLGRLLDIGTGTGRMIELLGERAGEAVGVDRSPEMLRLARGKLDAAGLASAEVRRADMYALPQPDGWADTVVIHQVLHFADDPVAALAEAARTLSPGGRLLVVDFLAHDREELRTAHAHTRLGFTDEQIETWLAAAGLRPGRGARLAPADGDGLTVALWTADRLPLARRIAA